MIGLPGCGKSTWAEQYRRTHKNVVILSSDEIRKELTGEYQCFEKEEEVWKTLDERIVQYSKQEEPITVIVDATNLKNKYRIHYYEVAKDYDVKWLVEIKKNWRKLLEGNKRRSKDKWVPLQAMKMLRDEYHLQLRQEPQGSSDFRLRSQGPCRLGTGESGLVLG